MFKNNLKYSALYMSTLLLGFATQGIAQSNTVTLKIKAGILKDAAGVAMPTDGLIVIAVDKDQNGFTGPDAEGFVNDDDAILFKGNLVPSETEQTESQAGVFTKVLANIELTNGIDLGDPVAIYWFPELTAGANTPPVGTPYGTFRDTSINSAPWVIHPAGSTITLEFITDDATDVPTFGTGPNAGDEDIASLTVPQESDNPDQQPGDQNVQLFAEDTSVNNNDWWQSDWFGFYNSSQGPWYYHIDLGYIFVDDLEPADGTWMWHAEMGWIWTESNLWPYLYSANSDGWLYQFVDSSSSVQFYDFLSGSWL